MNPATRSLSRALGRALLLASLAAPLAGQDLTGIWRTDKGSRYVVRHAGDELCWYFDPVNVFCGTVTGSLIVGSWLDLPTGPYRFSGRLVLRIESANRLVKVYESMRYGDAIWTRDGTPAGPVASTTTPASPAPAPAPTPAPLPAPAPAGGPPPYSPPPGGPRPAQPDENAAPMKWVYRAITEEYGNRIGKRIGFVCPPDPEPNPTWRATYGTGIYTGDTVVCEAAVHDGRITRSGGPVTVLIMPGLSSYRGSEQNGVKSVDYGKWGVAFSFSTEQVTYDQSRPPPPPAARPTEAPREVAAARAMKWSDPVPVELRIKPGLRIQFACPPGGALLGYVWGTGVYTGDSLPCAAAVHAGVITYAAGGTITVEIRPGQTSYQGSTRNGVDSRGFGEYATSFAIVK